MRITISLLLTLLTALLLSGCFYVGQQKIRVIPGTGTASRTVQDGDGEMRMLESPAPEGDTFFLFLRMSR